MNKVLYLLLLLFSFNVMADYDRNKAVPVEKVLFGQVESVRHISQEELVKDQHNGWHVFGGALIGGAIGHQFGGGSGQDIATVLGALIGASVANNKNNKQKRKIIQLVELMITTEKNTFMVIQDLDKNMLFQAKDKVRMVYLTDGTVRVDKQQ
ncbi:glycine zipper 2TM domain-containing protein [Litorilituus lipolyticus]|uniref:Glycine zipper 2TM domain-containing protein n=1 Tax=Litorilituus lipolyticus TaxID=2491017 RepID=A0A502L3C5_9GAMM|nr:glycine zipper 2TM domain-containing protein [Litorilituus lipolyticus]TPH17684.1 glycine zipper 2TM domain-containing protein [Litorilituus lipolyticus]